MDVLEAAVLEIRVLPLMSAPDAGRTVEAAALAVLLGAIALVQADAGADASVDVRRTAQPYALAALADAALQPPEAPVAEAHVPELVLVALADVKAVADVRDAPVALLLVEIPVRKPAAADVEVHVRLDVTAHVSVLVRPLATVIVREDAVVTVIARVMAALDPATLLVLLDAPIIVLVVAKVGVTADAQLLAR